MLSSPRAQVPLKASGIHGECAGDESFSARKSFGQINENMMEMKYNKNVASKKKQISNGIQTQAPRGAINLKIIWHWKKLDQDTTVS